MSDLREWRERYRAASLDAIPLRPKSKAPLCGEWQELEPDAQWARSRDYDGLNIGVRAGRGRAVIDADTAEAADLVDSRLQDMGLLVPKVATPRGGAHFYLQLTDAPADLTYERLSAAIGPGEFRVGPGAQVAAPPSVVGGRQYVFVRGAPEDVPALRAVAFRDCLWLVPSKTAPQQKAFAYELEETALLRWPIPKPTEALLKTLGTAERGAPIAGYASVSEAELAVCLVLVGTGRQLSEAAAIFESWKPAHYASYSQKGRRSYLAATYQKARQLYFEKPERRELAALHHDASARAWPGRTGATDRAVYLAALRLAWQLGRLEVNLATRDIAALAAVDRRTAGAALRRLSPLLTPTAGATCQKATTYRLQLPARLRASGESLEPSSAGDWPELWTRGRLGKIAAGIFAALTDAPQTAADLAAKTGHSQSAAYRALVRLAEVGLAVRTAVDMADGWLLGWRELADVAADLDAAGAAFARRQRHKSERAAYYGQHTECGGSCEPSAAR